MSHRSPSIFLRVLCVLLFSLPSLSAVDKSGVTPNTISLPEGPGSIEGLGESFEPAINNGTAKYAIPIKLPPGTAGHAPSISLSYDSGSGNGPLGYGWSLTLPYIQRQTDKGIPRYVDSTNGVDDDLDGEIDEWDEVDVCIEHEKEELVPCSNGYYFCETQVGFIRYERVGDHWEATRPDGTRLVFGSNATARVEGETTNHGMHGRTRKGFRWLLERETDVHGNTITYEYTTFPGSENTNQVYLSCVRYGPGTPPWNNYHFVSFQYGERDDWFEDCRAGFPIRTGMRLTNVVVGTHGPMLSGHVQTELDGLPGTDNLNREYRLSYVPRLTSHVSRLTGITPVGCDGVTSLPPTLFAYGGSESSNTVSAVGDIIGCSNAPPQVMDNGLVDLVDLNGDGLPDILKTAYEGGAHQVWINRGEFEQKDAKGAKGEIAWDGPYEVASADGLAWNVNLDDDEKVVHLADIDGDGTSDLWVKHLDESVHYFPNTTTNGWGQRRQMSVQDDVPPAPFGDENVKTADIDFDKRIDIIQSTPVGAGAYYQIWFNLGEQRYSKRVTVAQDAGYMLDLEGVEIADFNGDRVPDMTRIRPSVVEVQAGLGYGHFMSQVNVAITDATLTTEQLQRARLRDVTGDGLPELVVERAEPGVLWFWVNQGDYTFGEKKTISGMPTALGMNPSIRWADINGNGTTDLIYSDSTRSPRIQSVDVGELIGCGADHNLLTMIDNGIGGKTHIGYDTSTTFMLRDWDNPDYKPSRPLRPSVQSRCWPDPLPFPIKVVSSVVVDDSLGGLYTNTYAYHDGYYDGEEKEFRGFARVEVVNFGDASCPSLQTRSEFDTGREFECMKGKIRGVEQKDAKDAKVENLFFSRVDTAWELPPRVLAVGVNGQAVRIGYSIGTTNTISELGQGAERVLVTASAYDNYGNQTLNANYGIVSNGVLSAFDDERVVATDYAINTSAWLIRFPWREEIRDENGEVAARTEHFYDDETFAGNNGGVVTKGLLTMTRSWADPDDAGSIVTALRNTYDAFGNITAVRDALYDSSGDDHWRELDYEDSFHAYPIRETIYTGKGSVPELVIQAGYDVGHGVVASSTNPNGHLTAYGYDALARLTRIVKPGDSEAFPTAEFEYVLNHEVAGIESSNHEIHEIHENGTQQEAAEATEVGVSSPPSRPLRPSVQLSSSSSTAVNWVESRMRETAGGGTVDSRTFFDGLGRKVMTRAEGEFVNQVVVSDTVQFNTRGVPRRTYLPYFETNNTLDFVVAPYDGGFSEHVYDALGREVRVNQPADEHDFVAFSTSTYEPLVRILQDEEQTRVDSPHYGCGMRHVYDGLEDADGNPRLREVHELVRLTDDGESTSSVTEWKTTYTYDTLDNWTGYTDSQRNQKFVSYDGLGRKVFMNDPDRGYLWWAYDNVGNVLRRRDAKGQELAYVYDGVNRLTEEYHCVGGENLGGSLQAGDRWSVAVGSEPLRSPEVAYTYDEAAGPVDRGYWWNYATAEAVADAVLAGSTNLQFDINDDGTVDSADVVAAQQTENLVTASNVLGHLSWVSDTSGEEHNSYDSRGRCNWVVRRLDRAPIPNMPPVSAELLGFFAGFEFDSMDRPVRLTYPDRTQVDYGYNPRGLPEEISGAVGVHDYNPAGQNTRLEMACGTISDYTYDHRLRLNQCVSTRTRDGTKLQSLIYNFDAASNITGIEDGRSVAALNVLGGELGVGAAESAKFSMTQQFGYDSLYRLTGAANSNVYGNVDYRYDRIGNMVSKTAALTDPDPLMDLGTMTSGGTSGSWDRQGRAPGDQPGPHALTLIEHPEPSIQDRHYPYDANGNMLEIDGVTNHWDHNDRLIEIDRGTTNAVYAYDYTGTRKIRSVGDAASTNRTIVYYVDKFSEVRGDRLLKYVYDGDRRIARSSISPASPGTYSLIPDTFFLHDHLGSAHLSLSTNASLTEQSVNYPYGHPRLSHSAPSTTPNHYTFTGKERDLETGLHYFEARYHVAYLGRFASVDPLAVEASRLDSPQERNICGYGLGRPITMIDPSGMQTTVFAEEGEEFGGRSPADVYKTYRKQSKRVTATTVEDERQFSAAQAEEKFGGGIFGLGGDSGYKDARDKDPDSKFFVNRRKGTKYTFHPEGRKPFSIIVWSADEGGASGNWEGKERKDKELTEDWRIHGNTADQLSERDKDTLELLSELEDPSIKGKYNFGHRFKKNIEQNPGRGLFEKPKSWSR